MNKTDELKALFTCDGKFCEHCDNMECHKTSDPEHWEIIPKEAADGDFDNLMKFAPKIAEEIKSELGYVAMNAENYSYLESNIYFLYKSVYRLVRSVCHKADVQDETKQLLSAIATNFKDMDVNVTDNQKLSVIHQSLVLYMIYIIGPNICVN